MPKRRRSLALSKLVGQSAPVTTGADGGAAEAWDAEYAVGRYRDDPPVSFVADIIAAARAYDLAGAEGLYVGCGNGRNYLPLTEAGLDLVGLDVSSAALAQLAERAPERRARLVHGDLSALGSEPYSVVVGIQVFQHGSRAAAHDNIRAAQACLAPGGLFCLRVNAVGTDIEYLHDCIEDETECGGFTVRYLDGPKRGLLIHFFDLSELDSLFAGYERVVAPRLSRTWRVPVTRGQWSQWEAIYRRSEA
jgi:SAM-dependent methyltransferase